MNALTWLGMAFCLSQATMFSDLNFAVFGVSRLRLEIDAAGSGRAAAPVVTLLADSILTSAVFPFSTMVLVLFQTQTLSSPCLKRHLSFSTNA